MSNYILVALVSSFITTGQARMFIVCHEKIVNSPEDRHRAVNLQIMQYVSCSTSARSFRSVAHACAGMQRVKRRQNQDLSMVQVSRMRSLLLKQTHCAKICVVYAANTLHIFIVFQCCILSLRQVKWCQMTVFVGNRSSTHKSIELKLGMVQKSEINHSNQFITCTLRNCVQESGPSTCSPLPGIC